MRYRNPGLKSCTMDFPPKPRFPTETPVSHLRNRNPGFENTETPVFTPPAKHAAKCLRWRQQQGQDTPIPGSLRDEPNLLSLSVAIEVYGTVFDPIKIVARRPRHTTRLMTSDRDTYDTYSATRSVTDSP